MEISNRVQRNLHATENLIVALQITADADAAAFHFDHSSLFSTEHVSILESTISAIGEFYRARPKMTSVAHFSSSFLSPAIAPKLFRICYSTHSSHHE